MTPTPPPTHRLVTILGIVLLGLILGVLAYLPAQGRVFGKGQHEISPPVIPVQSAITLTGQVPNWLGIYARAPFDRFPLYYCLKDTAGGSWTQRDHDMAYDGLTTAWGWGKINRTIAVQIQERCDELPWVTVFFVKDSAFVQSECQPGTPFNVAACVSFHGYLWAPDVNAWLYDYAIVHVDAYDWAVMTAPSSNSWPEHVIIHEWGHAGLGLGDTPAQPCGTTVMDYTYEPACGQLPYARAADIAVTNSLYGGYKNPAWACGIGLCPVRKR